MRPRVSVVAPVHDEAAALPELAARCLRAARRLDPHAEVLLVDDASTDATRAVAATLPQGVRTIHLDHNRGQLGATRVGLDAAAGDVVVVLDGDLQDPPEVMVSLVEALWAAPHLDVVFAAKVARHDPWWMRVGRAAFGLLLAVPGARAVPPSTGSYCAMRRTWARRVARVPLTHANLAPLLVALGAHADVRPYVKQARYDDASRVGPAGLVREALGSLVITGAVGVWLGVAALLAAVLAIRSRRLASSWLGVALALALAAPLVGRRTRAALARAQELP